MSSSDLLYLLARLGLALLWLFAAWGALRRARRRTDSLAGVFAAFLLLPVALSIADAWDNLVLRPDPPIPWTSWVWMLFDGVAPLLCLRLLRALGERDAAEMALRVLAETDTLTSLPNRRAFTERAGAAITAARGQGVDCSLLLFDLDRFKTINDGWGHTAGDQVLRALADTLRTSLRQVDLPVRLGGEEFGVLLPATDAAQAMVLAERLRAAVRQGVPHPGGAARGPVTVSIGVATLRRDGLPQAALEAALQAADAALYAAKNGGRDQVRAAEPAMAAA